MTESPAEAVEAIQKMNKVMNDLAGHSDRELAIVGIAIIEDEMRSLLTALFSNSDEDLLKKIFENSGPLNPFVSRAHLCFALGAIKKDVYEDLKRVAKIRNLFAHKFDADFDDPDMAKLFSGLKIFSQEAYSSCMVSIGVSLDDSGRRYVMGKQVSVGITDANFRALAYLTMLDDHTKSKRAKFANALRLLWFVLVSKRLATAIEAASSGERV